MSVSTHAGRWLGATLLAALAWARPAVATTYPALPEVESLEWKLVNADLVVRGTVISVRDLPDLPPTVRGVATVSVDEVLKGERVASVECVVFGDLKTSLLPQWQREGTEGLFLLNTGSETAVGGLLPPGISYDLRQGSAALLGRGYGPRLFSMERAAWLEPADLLDAAQKALSDRPGDLQNVAPCLVTFPDDSEPDSQHRHMVVTCPVDRHLERGAQDWVRSSNAWQRL